MAWDDDLTPGTSAHSIAGSQHNRICVLAGPGTGKSFSMKRRVARLLEEGVPPDEILAVTFTRVAADDLHRELVALDVPGADSLVGRTLHSLSMRILMRNHVLQVMDRQPRPLNEYELKPLLADLSNTHGNVYARKRLIRSYGAAWARLQRDIPGYAMAPADLAFANELVDWLRLHHAMLMDEIVPHLLQYLRNNPGCPELTEFSHLLIDEYQDLNKAEQEVLQLLGANGRICVIGDDDQSIYSFKHAHPEGIQIWPHENQSENHSIDECYRCPVTVVQMANALIARNPRPNNRMMNEMANKGLGEVVIRQFTTAEQEGQAVAQKIQQLIDGGVAPGEIIVLAQRNTFAHPIYLQLRQANIPVKSYYAESALDTDEAQEKYAILKLLIDNDDRVALRWLLGKGHGTWHKNAYRRVMTHVRDSGDSPWNTLHSLLRGETRITYTGRLVDRFREITETLAELEQAKASKIFLIFGFPKMRRLNYCQKRLKRCGRMQIHRESY